MSEQKNEKLKTKTRAKLEKIFAKMACKDPKTAIHGTAAAAALIVAVLPIGIDAWALRVAEVLMLMSVYAHYGIKLTESAAESLLTAAFAQAVGEAAAYTALEAADMAAPLTAGATLMICYTIAAGLIEAIGWTTVKSLEGNKLAKGAVCVMGTIGAAADAVRVVNAAETIVGYSSELQNTAVDGVASSNIGNAGQISFTGDTLLKRIHELELKIEALKSKIKIIEGWIESDVKFGRDTTLNKSKLKYALNELDQFQKELARLVAASA